MHKAYLQDMRKADIPKGTYHVARWHNNGKLWISDLEKSDDYSTISDLVETKNRVAAGHGWGMATRYFVWHSELSTPTIELYKDHVSMHLWRSNEAESDANKIK